MVTVSLKQYFTNGGYDVTGQNLKILNQKGMQMRKIRTESRPVEVLEDVICDCCGNSCGGPHGEYAHGLYDAGYESKLFGDGTLFGFEVCEQCFWDWTKDFLHPLKDLCPRAEEE
jgi:hypothetical protein